VHVSLLSLLQAEQLKIVYAVRTQPKHQRMMVQILSLLLVTALSAMSLWADAFTLSPFLHSRLTAAQSKFSYCPAVHFAAGNDAENNVAPPLPVIVPTSGVPIYLYTGISEIETEALEQLKRLAESPLPVDYVSAIPDVHWGKGVTIGSVFASDKYVCPNAVGVDIGCGMAAIPIEGLYKWDLTNDDKNQIQQLLKDRIPTGPHSYDTPLPGTNELLDQLEGEIGPTSPKRNATRRSSQESAWNIGRCQSHFLEVVFEEESGQVWIMLHSGSRGIGIRIASHYDLVAKEKLKKKGVDTDLTA
jgi:hypothetical protein